MKVVIIGSGNAATVLGRKIKIAGHDILQVYSRHLYNAEELADELGCAATDNWNSIISEAQLYIVAISDKALNELAENWHITKGMVVHTAGGVTREVLKNVSKNYGVLYPLQSLKKEKYEYDVIPLLTDANNEDDHAFLTDFATTISTIVKPADDDYRMRLHVAAVIVNNFTNHLYALAEAYCNSTGVSFALLKPLITETAIRIQEFPPALAQTGPAKRGDINTIEKHLSLLKEYPPLFSLYGELTKSIQQTVSSPIH